MKKAILLTLLSLPLLATPVPEIEFDSLTLEYPAPAPLRDQGSTFNTPLTINLKVQNSLISRKTRQEIYIKGLQLTDARGNDLKPEFSPNDTYDNKLTISSQQIPQGNSIYISGTAYIYQWEETTTLPALQPDWEKGCTFTQNGMQIRCSAGTTDHLYRNEKFIPTPSYRVEITAPQDDLIPVQEVIPFKADGSPFSDGECVYDYDDCAKHGSYTFNLISATPPVHIQLNVAANTKRYRIPFRMRLGLPGRLNLPADNKR